MDKAFSTRIPQQEDGVRELLARQSAGPKQGSGLASAARTATTSTTGQAPSGYETVTASLSITVAGAAGGLTLAIQAMDGNGAWITLAQDVSARTTTFYTNLQVGKHAVQSGSAAIPGNPAINGRCWDINAFSQIRATVTHSTADAYTYALVLIFS